MSSDVTEGRTIDFIKRDLRWLQGEIVLDMLTQIILPGPLNKYDQVVPADFPQLSVASDLVKAKVIKAKVM
jgi:hypothetical protein